MLLIESSVVKILFVNLIELFDDSFDVICMYRIELEYIRIELNVLELCIAILLR